MKRVDLTGQRFGKLLVVGVHQERSKDKRLQYNCVCDCGNEKLVVGHELRLGKVKSCGCLRGNPLALGLGALNAEYAMQKNKALTQRNKGWELSKEEFSTLVYDKCYYCGREPFRSTNYRGNGNIVINGIDRIDNNIGYVYENCVTACWDCNRAKGEMTYTEFTNLVELIYKNGVTHG